MPDVPDSKNDIKEIRVAGSTHHGRDGKSVRWMACREIVSDRLSDL
jgi:hypothetical protein